MKNKSRK